MTTIARRRPPATVPGLMSNTGYFIAKFHPEFHLQPINTNRCLPLFPSARWQAVQSKLRTDGDTHIGKGNGREPCFVTSIRSNLQVRNFFTGSDDVATRVGFGGFWRE